MLSNLVGLRFVCDSWVSSLLHDLCLKLLSAMTQCVYYLDYDGILDFVGLIPNQE